jgi:hypothetical protein
MYIHKHIYKHIRMCIYMEERALLIYKKHIQVNSSDEVKTLLSCIYVCIFINICINIYVCVYIWKREPYSYTRNTYQSTVAWRYHLLNCRIYICVYVCMFIYEHIYKHTCMCIYTYAYTQIYFHIYTYTFIRVHAFRYISISPS